MVETDMANSNMVNIMLANENLNSSDRILSLENKLKQQNDEIVILKSALSDVIRRLQQIENAHHTSSNTAHTHISTNHISTNGHSIKNPIQSKPPSNMSATKSRSNINNSNVNGQNHDSASLSSRKTKGPNDSIVSSNSNTSNTSILIKSSSSNSLSGSKSIASLTNNSNKVSINASVDYNNHPLQFNKDAGSVKFFLRGRPITLYLPIQFQVSESSNDIGFNFEVDSLIKAPRDHLKLEWVYGYRGKDCRTNLHSLPTGECVYFMAAVVILYNIEEGTQRHYIEHTDDIKSLAIHPDRVTIATGQSTGHGKDAKAHVRIWDSVNLTTLKTIGLSNSINDFTNAVCCLSFSKCDGGSLLCCVDDASDKWLSVWQWQTGAKVASIKCYGDLVFSAEFHPMEKNLIITCGKQHIMFWQLDQQAQHLTKRNGSFESYASTSQNLIPKIEKPKYVLALAFSFSNGEVISGDSEGNIVFWNPKENKITRAIKDAHEGGVFSILYLLQDANGLSNSVLMVTGGKDGKIIEWNSDYQKSRSLQIPEVHGACRFITQMSNSSQMYLVGTTRNCIYQANFDLNIMKCVVNGHFEELWGLSNNLREANFLTCGNDKSLCYWDTLSHSQVWSTQFEDQLHSAHIHPIHDLVAVGFTKNKWIVYDFVERKTIYSQIEGTEQIEVIRYSPNGLYLAAGSRDNYIYLYNVSEDGLKYSRCGRCNGHSSFITHIDWSVDSDYLISNSGDYEVLHWQASTCKQVTQVQKIRELKWATNSCTLSFNTLGIWNSSPVESLSTTSSPSLISSNSTAPSNNNGHGNLDGTDINACYASPNNNLLVTVDDFGKVNLFNYPCNGSKGEKRVYFGHSSHVTNVTFINNETRLITIGGNDMAIFQWAVIKE